MSRICPTGSSPLARGTPERAEVARPERRFIPARAGNTTGRIRPPTPIPVHPRSRGEHCLIAGRMNRKSGSSPLARGTPTGVAVRRLRDRFIPARAGNTSRGARPDTRPAVHPRSRGEHGRVPITSGSHVGSSPLARGTPCPPTLQTPILRFIPARAGNTPAAVRLELPIPVHPRSRGEHALVMKLAPWVGGSSPLARGTRARGAVATTRDRFIPARAGNTPRGTPCAARTPVHPRSRGEHGRLSTPSFRVTGSSPLARGTRQPIPEGVRRLRFIPARAGNTLHSQRRAPDVTVHPRSRGEHSPERISPRSPPGSSPLARGTPGPVPCALHMSRFIPARAGNTADGGRAPADPAVHPRSRGEHTTTRFASTHSSRFIPARAGNTTGRSPGRGRAPVHPRSRGEH